MAKLTDDQRKKKLLDELVKLEVKQARRSDAKMQKELAKQKKRGVRAKALVATAMIKKLKASQGEELGKTAAFLRRLAGEHMTENERNIFETWLVAEETDLEKAAEEAAKKKAATAKEAVTNVVRENETTDSAGANAE